MKNLRTILRPIIQVWNSASNFRLQGGAQRLSPTFSNRSDCHRFGCQMSPWHWATRWVLERAQLSEQKVVMDLGAGTNPIALEVYEKSNAQVYLIDNLVLPSKKSSPYIERICADISNLPLPNESIDVAISVSVIEHLPVEKRLVMMAELARVLKPGGRALLTIGVPLKASAEARFLMSSLPFFVERGCPIYFPINIEQMLTSVPTLRLAATEGLEYIPGYRKYDEHLLMQDSNLVVDTWDHYPALTPYPVFNSVVHCEIGIMLFKL